MIPNNKSVSSSSVLWAVLILIGMCVLTSCGAPPQNAGVSAQPCIFVEQDASQGVMWAAKRISNLGLGSITKLSDGETDITCGVIATRYDNPVIRKLLKQEKLKLDKAWLGEEGFQIQTLTNILPDNKNMIVVMARNNGGLMSGLLELEERLGPKKHARFPAINMRDKPAFKYRMISMKLPLYTGDDNYGWHLFNKPHVADYWFKKDWWHNKFKTMAALRQNGVALWAPHPYAALIRYKKYPEAAYYSVEETERNIRMFKWILATGRQYNIKFYLMHWNIHYTPGFAKAHNLPMGNAEDVSDTLKKDAPIVRKYMRYCVRTLLDTYPQLAGLGGCPAESPGDCYEFVKDSIINPLINSGFDRTFIMRTWSVKPKNLKYMLEGFKGNVLLTHKTNSESTYMPKADPRIKMWHDRVDIPIIGLGSGDSNILRLLWFDPEFVKNQLANFYRNGGRGIITAYRSIGDFLPAAGSKYAWNPLGKYDRNHWIKLVATRYGLSREKGQALFESMTLSSFIMPRVLCQFFADSMNTWRPQLGLPLHQYFHSPFGTDMPTLSTFRRTGERDAGFAWPNQDWGERFYEISEYVDNQISEKKMKGTTPIDMSNQLESAARRSLKKLEFVHKADVPKNRAEFDNLTEYIKLNDYIGLHFAAKIKAAIFWRFYQRTGKQKYAGKCLTHLKESVKWWERVSSISSKVQPKPFNLLVGGHIEKRHWKENLPLFKKELEVVRQCLAKGPAYCGKVPRISMKKRIKLYKLKGNDIALEAEDFDRKKGQILVFETGAAGKGWAKICSGYGFIGLEEGSCEFDVDVTKAGKYAIWVRHLDYAKGSRNIEFFLDGEMTGKTRNTKKTITWGVWTKIGIADLEKRKYSLLLRKTANSDKRAYADVILLTQDPEYVPGK